MRSDPDVGRQGLVPLQIHPKVLPLLVHWCAVRLEQEGTITSCSYKVGAWNCPNSPGTLKCKELLSLRHQAQFLNNNPTSSPPSNNDLVPPIRVATNTHFGSISGTMWLESSGGVLHTTAADALYWWCTMQLLYGISLSSLCTLPEHCWPLPAMLLSICWPWSVTLRGLPFHGWAAIIPNCFHSVRTPLMVDCGIFNSEDILQLDLLNRWHLIW